MGEGGLRWDWREQRIVPEYYDRMLAALRTVGAPGPRVLEVGVGCGYVLAHLSREWGVSGYGVDNEPSAMLVSQTVAAQAGTRLGLVRGDGLRLPFPEGAFDFVYSLGVIEHFDPADTDVLLREHVRVVRPGGMLAVSVPNLWNPFHTFLKWRLGERYPFHPERSYSPQGLRRLLERHGVTVEGDEGYGLFWSLWNAPWRWTYYVSAACLRLGLDHDFEARLAPRVRSRLGMMTLAWGRRAS